jgi:hypothetical protein
VWPWLVQMGWHRAGWYTARWVDKLLFPLNWPSGNRIVPGLQHLQLGDFIPDGAPETKTGLTVEALEPGRAMALHSTSHLPLSWRGKADLDWSWTFVRLPLEDGRRTRFLFRSRWVTSPWWFTLGGWLGIVPADFVMARDMLNGVKQRSEALVQQRYPSQWRLQPKGRSQIRRAVSRRSDGTKKRRWSSTIKVAKARAKATKPITNPADASGSALTYITTAWQRLKSPAISRLPTDLGRFHPGRLERQQPSIARRSGSARARHDMTVHPCAKGRDSQQHQNSHRAESVN